MGSAENKLHVMYYEAYFSTLSLCTKVKATRLEQNISGGLVECDSDSHSEFDNRVNIPFSNFIFII